MNQKISKTEKIMIKTFKTFWTDYGTCIKMYGNWLKKQES